MLTTEQKEIIENNLSLVKDNIYKVINSSPNVEDWLWESVQDSYDYDSNDMIEFLDDYYLSSLKYIGLDLDNLN